MRKKKTIRKGCAETRLSGLQYGECSWPVICMGYKPKEELTRSERDPGYPRCLHRPKQLLKRHDYGISSKVPKLLGGNNFGKRKKLDFYLENEPENLRSRTSIKKAANDGKFFETSITRITEHLESSADFEVLYVFIYGGERHFSISPNSKFWNILKRISGSIKLIVYLSGQSKATVTASLVWWMMKSIRHYFKSNEN